MFPFVNGDSTLDIENKFVFVLMTENDREQIQSVIVVPN